MADVVILGAGLNGLAAALLLAGDGHHVTVLERDPHAPPPPACAWSDWVRRGVNQFRHPHFMLPRWHATMSRELPDVTAELLAVGGQPFNVLEASPAAGPRRDGDERFDTIAARRPVIERALAAVVERTARIEVRRGVAVTGLVAGARSASGENAAVPHVTGVRVDRSASGHEVVRADLVVDAGGRRSALPELLGAIGAAPVAEERDDCGFVYYARHFRSRDGSTPACRGGLLQHHPSVSVLTLPGDRPPGDQPTWAVAIIASARDRALRALRDPATWDAALAMFPLAAHWGCGEPITGVDAIAGIEDRHRRFVVDGEPVATGVVALGDAWACTNPSVGRGASIGLLHAVTLRDVIREHDPAAPGDDAAQKLQRRFAEATDEVVEPFYRATLASDRHRLAEVDADIAGTAYEPDDAAWTIATAMANAAAVDAEVARGYGDIAGMIATPDEVLQRPGMFDRIVAAGADGPRYRLPGPTRQELVEVVGR